MPDVDPPTLFIMIVLSSLCGAFVLTWAWLQNKADHTLLWVSAAYILSSIGSLLFSGRERISDLFTIDVGTTFALLAFGLCWTAARTFNRRPTIWWVPLAGPVVWLLLARVPLFHDVFAYRVSFISAITTTYLLMAAREFWGSDGLHSRYPLSIVLATHAVIVAIRIPISLSSIGEVTKAFSSPWFGPIALESVIFIQLTAYLVLSLTKERVEARLRDVALRDPLTDLPNRRALFDQGEVLIADTARNKRPISVLTFDLDRFKLINDTYGHPVGDAVIRTFATAARQALRTRDPVGRIGGEEFAVILADANETDARVVATRILDMFAELAATVEGCNTACTTSVGIAVSAQSRHSVQELLVMADGALYEAKRQGGNCLRVAAAA